MEKDLKWCGAWADNQLSKFGKQLGRISQLENIRIYRAFRKDYRILFIFSNDLNKEEEKKKKIERNNWLSMDWGIDGDPVEDGICGDDYGGRKRKRFEYIFCKKRLGMALDIFKDLKCLFDGYKR